MSVQHEEMPLDVLFVRGGPADDSLNLTPPIVCNAKPVKLKTPFKTSPGIARRAVADPIIPWLNVEDPFYPDQFPACEG